jgi:hypothetical protein
MRNLSMVFCLIVSITAASAAGDERTYGTLESHSAGSLVVRTKTSVGHWKMDAASKVNGQLAPFAWVFVDVEQNGHVKSLKVEEAPTARTGVIKQIEKNVVVVRSGSSDERWNLVPTTYFADLDRSSLRPGDELAARTYKNHNLAEVRRLKSGVKLH